MYFYGQRLKIFWELKIKENKMSIINTDIVKIYDSKLKLLSQLTIGNKILDIGCAEFPNNFLNGEVYGLDIQKMNKPKNYLEFKQVNLNKQKMPYPDNFLIQ